MNPIAVGALANGAIGYGLTGQVRPMNFAWGALYGYGYQRAGIKGVAVAFGVSLLASLVVARAAVDSGVVTP